MTDEKTVATPPPWLPRPDTPPAWATLARDAHEQLLAWTRTRAARRARSTARPRLPLAAPDAPRPPESTED